MKGRAVFDVSSFMLFEATGDSETDLDVAEAAVNMAEDDARSSSACINEFGDDKVAPSNTSVVLPEKLKKLKYWDDDRQREEMEKDGSITGVYSLSDQEWGGDKVAPPNISTVSTLVHQQGKKLKIGYDDHSQAGEEMEEDDSCSTTGVVDQKCGGDEVALATTWAGYAAAVPEKTKKLKNCEGPNIKLMNQRERDRLFWEACFAS
ncbi:Uncharacterized protein Fot_01465 [Forsythia ovata]|uniref:Uncharacterized protein n=1 Tax=Forsythia ovata TaxID=205694 RepID=A0ABD1X407_9LAMI